MRDIYCPKCVALTPHTGELYADGGSIFYCQNPLTDSEGKIIVDQNNQPKRCDMFVKFPPCESADALDELIAHREIANKDNAELVALHQKQKLIIEEVLLRGTKVQISSTDGEAAAQTPLDQPTTTT